MTYPNLNFFNMIVLSCAIILASCEKEADDLPPPTENGGYHIEYGEMTDSRDGKTYKTIEIGNQVWMAENLAFLPEVTFEDEWGSNTEQQYAVYGYTPGSGNETVEGAKQSDNYKTYGVLYNWSAAMANNQSSTENSSGVKGICPSGWHLPSDEEWKELEMTLGMTQDQVDSLGWRGKNKNISSKMASNASLWNEATTIVNNPYFGKSGFTALPGGRVNFLGFFEEEGSYAYWWSSTENQNNFAFFRGIYYASGSVLRNSQGKDLGVCIR